ncbi:MAG: GIY-YIG nuclease family protein [Chitinophagales bacterium]
MKRLYVYILKCSEDSYYTGVTNDVDERVSQHNEGYYPKAYTFNRRPVKLVYVEEFQEYHEAIEWEKQIKGWTRAKKEALIRNNWDKLHELAECKNETHFKHLKK